MLSSKSFITIWVESLKVFLIGYMYDRKSSVIIDLWLPKVKYRKCIFRLSRLI